MVFGQCFCICAVCLSAPDTYSGGFEMYSYTKRKISPCCNRTLLLFALDPPLLSAYASCFAERCTNSM
jgi:hypothetical protein